MKHCFIIIILLVCALNTSAQTYLEHLQTREAGKGNVTVHQSRELDILVNGPAPVAKKPTTTQATATKKKTTPEAHETTQPKVTTVVDEETDAPAIDNSKKIVKGGYKVIGYRVQVFAGGNSRKDKSKAEQTGAEMKSLFPGYPVYVHFYSPRWICRMGNFRDYEEAQAMLARVKAAGYKQASLVKGQITVAKE